MNNELILNFEFVASHTLPGDQGVHPHTWRLEIALRGKTYEGKILDIVLARSSVGQLISSLANTFLNDNLRVTQAVRQIPTCETLCQFFWKEISEMVQFEFQKHNPSLRLYSLGVGLADPGEKEMGFVRIWD